MIDTNDQPSKGRDDVDELLRETFRDDLPAEAEARLERRIQRFLASRAEARRRPGLGFVGAVWAPGQRVLAVAASLLLACGLGLQASAGPDRIVEPLSDVSATMTLVRAIRGATAMRCTGLEDAGLASPAALADRIYRRWVPLRTRTRPDGAVVHEFRARDEPLRYQLVSDDVARPPREIRRRPLNDAAPGGGTGRASVATCTWEAPPAGTPGIVLMLGR